MLVLATSKMWIMAALLAEERQPSERRFWICENIAMEMSSNTHREASTFSMTDGTGVVIRE